MTTPRKPSKPPATPRAVTASYLRNAAMHYLSQRAASTSMVRQTLTRRAGRRLGVKRLDDDARTLIETVLSDLVALGLIDDTRFAEVRATTLAARGLSKTRISLGLRAKGIGKETIEATDAVTAVDDLSQARRYIARKRLGSFRRDASPSTRDKDLRALARAGFSYHVAARALATGDDET